MAEIKFSSAFGSKLVESYQFCRSWGTKSVNCQKDDRIKIQNCLVIFSKKSKKTSKSLACPKNPEVNTKRDQKLNQVT